MERKALDISSFKFSSDGSGTAEGVFNKMFIVDDGGDITIALSDRNHFLKRGFIADTHGMGNGSGNYTTATEVGIPKTLDVLNGDEIYGSFEFHDTEYAQDCRKVMSKRTSNGLVAPYSIGYDLAEAPIFIYNGTYETELKNYIPAQYLDRCIEAAKKWKKVRLINVILNEVSTVPIPMNTESQATEVKTKMEKKDAAANDASEITWLGSDIPESITLTILDLLWCRFIWACYRIKWDDAPNAGKLFLAAFAEFADYVQKYVPLIMATDDEEGITETDSAMKSIFGEEEQILKSLANPRAGLKFAQQAEALLADVSAMNARTKALAELRAKASRSLSKETRDNINTCCEKCETAIKEMRDYVTSKDATEEDDSEKNAKTATETPEIDLSALAAKKSAIDLEIVNRQINSRK